MHYDAPPPSHYEYSDSLDELQVLRTRTTAFTMMTQLEGWCSYDKGAVLVDLVLQYKPRIIVEIGVFGGKSLIPMAYAQSILGIGKTYGIDPWSSTESIQNVQDPANIAWWGKLDHEFIFQGLKEKIKAFKLQDQIELIKMTSADAPPIASIDMLHIDGNHSEKSSLFDVMKWVPHVNSGGFILFDDIGWSEKGVNTTGAAVNWLNENCIEFAQFADAAPWAIWIKP